LKKSKIIALILLFQLFFSIRFNVPMVSGLYQYSEDFNNGNAENWTDIDGTLSVSNGVAQTNNSNYLSKSYCNLTQFSDFKWEGDFNLKTGSAITLLFYIQSITSGLDKGFFYQIQHMPAGVASFQIGLARVFNSYTWILEIDQDFQRDQWYHFKLIVNGTNLEYYLNNSLIMTYGGLIYNKGYIGVKTYYGSQGLFDNFDVSGASYNVSSTMTQTTSSTTGSSTTNSSSSSNNVSTSSNGSLNNDVKYFLFALLIGIVILISIGTGSAYKKNKIQQKSNIKSQKSLKTSKTTIKKELLQKNRTNQTIKEKILLEKFQKIINVSNRVKQAQIASNLGITQQELFNKVVAWGDTLPIKIEGDEIVVNDVSKFSGMLDKQFMEWEKLEAQKKGKIE
jgi:3-keto-disaccharide hydrolase